MSFPITVAKFQVKNKTVYVKLHWQENEYDLFKIYVYDGDQCWSGRFSIEFAEKYREITEQSPEEYNLNAKKCLAGEDDSYVFDFSPVQDDQESATFSWKKKFDGALLVFGAVPVHREKYSNIITCSIIDHLLEENEKLTKNITDLENHVLGVKKELVKCRNDMEQFVSIKSSLETSLYGKFVLLLNTKKDRIKHLEQQILSLEGNENVAQSELD